MILVNTLAALFVLLAFSQPLYKDAPHLSARFRTTKSYPLSPVAKETIEMRRFTTPEIFKRPVMEINAIRVHEPEIFSRNLFDDNRWMDDATWTHTEIPLNSFWPSALPPQRDGIASAR